MIAFVVRRTGLAAVSIFGVSALSFVVLRVIPGDPARQVLGPFVTPEQLAAFRAENGLDGPLPTQYWSFVSNFATGDWGFSYGSGVPVRELFAQRASATIELGLVAFAFALAFAVVAAIAVTYRRRPGLDRAVRGTTFLALGLPQFWLGLLLLLLLSQQLPVFPGPEGQLSRSTEPVAGPTGLVLVDSLLAGRPAAFADAAWHLVLPAFTLGFSVWAYLLGLLRANLLEVAGEPYLTVVEAKGVSRRRAFIRHALPNAALPTLTAFGLVLGQLLAATVIVEAVYDWPGIGGLVVRSIGEQDFAVVQVFVLISATAVVLANFLVDVLYGLIDPRIRTLRSAPGG